MGEVGRGPVVPTGRVSRSNNIFISIQYSLSQEDKNLQDSPFWRGGIVNSDVVLQAFLLTFLSFGSGDKVGVKQTALCRLSYTADGGGIFTHISGVIGM